MDTAVGTCEGLDEQDRLVELGTVRILSKSQVILHPVFDSQNQLGSLNKINLDGLASEEIDDYHKRHLNQA